MKQAGKCREDHWADPYRLQSLSQIRHHLTSVQILSSSPLTNYSKTCPIIGQLHPSHWTSHLTDCQPSPSRIGQNRTTSSGSSGSESCNQRRHRILYTLLPPVIGDSPPGTRVTLPNRLLILMSISWELSSSHIQWSWPRTKSSQGPSLLHPNPKSHPPYGGDRLRHHSSSYLTQVQDICRTKSSQGPSSE